MTASELAELRLVALQGRVGQAALHLGVGILDLGDERFHAGQSRAGCGRDTAGSRTEPAQRALEHVDAPVGAADRLHQVRLLGIQHVLDLAPAHGAR